MTRFAACWIAAALFSASAWAQKSSLGAGEYVTTGQYLQSPNKTYLAVQQKELELLEERLKKKLEEGQQEKPS